jgi:hypothetical protein
MHTSRIAASNAVFADEWMGGRSSSHARKEGGKFSRLLDSQVFDIHWYLHEATKSPGRRTGLENLSANPNGQQQKHKAGGVKVGEHSAQPNSDNQNRQGWPNDQEQHDWKYGQHSGLRLAALGLVIWPIKLNARLNKVSADLAQNP